ncbi:MAG: hypothetical protein MI919_16315, partial [Holophagales bacterium]|nr:hypothetical protein [Holophagales bacterium]
MADGVLLLKMPWGPWGGVDSPSLGLGVLKAVLGRSGIPADVLEAQLLMLPLLPYPRYMFFSTTRMLGEFAFTEALQGPVTDDQMAVLERIAGDRETRDVWKVTGNPGDYDPRRAVDLALTMRNELIPAYLERVLDRLELERYALVGFNCIFDQTLASIALAKKIKERRPEVVTAFGGAAFHGEVGRHLLAVFPEAVDVVSSGDGEDVIGPLFEAARGERPFSEVHNIS